MTDRADHNEQRDAARSHDGDFDPMIADRFRVLDRITPPDVTRHPLAMAAPGRPVDSEPRGRRSGFLLAVAACLGALVLGIGALVAVNDGDGTDLVEQADEVGDNPIVADDADDTSDATVPLVVDGEVASTTRSESDDDETGPAESGADGVESGSASEGSSGDDGSGDQAPTTAAGPDVVAPAADGDRPVATFSTATTDVLPTSGGDGGGEAAGTVSLRGTVTEVFTDCVSRFVLTEAGEVVASGPISCDGGSYIIVDGTRVFTSSGFTSADLAFDKHPSTLKPGQQVSVTATRTGGAGGPLTLDCDSCAVRII